MPGKALTLLQVSAWSFSSSTPVAQWVKVFAAQAWPPELNSQNPWGILICGCLKARETQVVTRSQHDSFYGPGLKYLTCLFFPLAGQQ